MDAFPIETDDAGRLPSHGKVGGAMAGAQRSCLHTLCEEAKETSHESLTKAAQGHVVLNGQRRIKSLCRM